MGPLRDMANKCKYKRERQVLKEHFMYGINDAKMMTEIIKELIAIK